MAGIGKPWSARKSPANVGSSPAHQRIPRSIKFWTAGGVWCVKIDGEEGMDADNYLSSGGADTGVTIADNGFTVANGANVNSVGNPVYYEVEG